MGLGKLLLRIKMSLKCKWCNKPNPMFWTNLGGFCNYSHYEKFFYHINKIKKNFAIKNI